MNKSSKVPSWTQQFVYRSEKTRTTWKFRIGLVVVIVAVVWLTRGWWTVAIASSLVCESNAAPSDAILVENFDPPEYLAFERAERLRRNGMAARVLVPVWVDADTSHINEVSRGTTEVMAKIAHLGEIDIVPVQQVEPISLNTARDVLRFVEQEHIRSVIVVSPLFRSRRSALVSEATFRRAGVRVTCDPVEGIRGVTTWTESWHGLQEVAEQLLKLQYYKLYVLPFRAAR